MSERFANLQALRGIACLMVVMFHAAGQAEFWYAGFQHNLLRPALWFGYAGVDVFFVLSGFIITASAARYFGRPSAIPDFLFRRAWRVYPLFWCVLAAEFLYLGLAMDMWIRPRTNNVLLLPQKGNVLPPLVCVSWSLVYEMYFYGVFAVLMLVPRRLAVVGLATWGVAAVVAGAAVQAKMWWNPNRFVVVALSPYVFEFCLGCVAAGLVRSGVCRGGRTCVAAGLAWAAAAIGITLVSHPAHDWLSHNLGWHVLAFGPASALVVYGLAAAERAGRVPPSRWLQSVGDWSYSIYLTHVMVIWAATLSAYKLNMPHTVLADWLWCTAVVLGSVALGWAVHRLAERPLLNLVRKKRPTPVLAVPERAPLRAAA